VPWPPIIGSRQPASRPPAASPGERSAHLDPGHRSHDPWQLSRTRDQAGTPNIPRQPHDTTPQTTTNQAQDLQSLDVPLHMSAPPLLPGLMEASVCTADTSSAERSLSPGTCTVRLRALTMPDVTVPDKPSGAPIATTG